MKKRMWIVLAAAVWMTPMLPAQRPEAADTLLQTAVKKEMVDGNFAGAIETYKKAMAAAKGNRAVVAMALVHIAECHRKMGDAESRKLYEQVVREYGDQKEAVTLAQTRLGESGPYHNAGIVTRQVWTGPKADPYDGTISADGRYLSFADWGTGNLGIHDLSTGTDRYLTNKRLWSDSKEFAEESAIAPDGKRVAYAWFNGKGRYELRTVNIGPAAIGTPRTLCDNEEIPWIAPSAWSPDGKWIAVNIGRPGRAVQIGLLDAESGALRILKSGEWAGAGRLAFSPDGRYIAYDRPSVPDSDQRDVFILAVDGSIETPAVVHPSMDTVVGWSPDGRKLLFASDRTGSTSIWTLPVRDGKPQGSAELIKSDVGRFYPLGVARSGVVYFGVKVGAPDIYVASVDVNSGKLLSRPTPVTEQFIGFNRQPDWSPDGRYLAYVTLGNGGRLNVLTIQSLEGGKLRQLHPKLGYFQWPRWSPDSASFLVQGTDLKGRSGVFRIDARTGNAELVVLTVDEMGRLPQWAPDGKRIYYGSRVGGYNPAADATIIERDLASGKERELFRSKEIAWRSISLSPDGRYVACSIVDQNKKQTALMIVPVAGGEPRELLRQPGNSDGFLTWSADGRHILATGTAEVYLISAADGKVRRSENFGLTDIRGLRVQPGGNKLAFWRIGPNSSEVWSLENLMPVLNSKK